MSRPPRRTFTLLDAIVLVAATAVGFAWVRSRWDFETFEGPKEWLGAVPEMLAPLLMTWTVAVVVLRLFPPRPLLRRLALQPGAAACGSVALTFTMKSLRYFVWAFAGSRGIPWHLFRNGSELVSELCDNAFVGGSYHYEVVAVWVLLFLSRRCRPEPSWIDRVGRVIGLIWLLLGVWSWSEIAIYEWRAAPNR
jgi:hypothetical protein